MDNTISRFGCQLEIHNVDGGVLRQLCELLEISKTRTTAYRPASNEQVERYNRLRLLGQILRCYINKQQRNWNIHLHQLTGAIRTTENRQTGFSPNSIVFGREVTQPVDLMLGLAGTEGDGNGQLVTEYVKNLAQNLQEIHALARMSIGMAQHRQK